MMGLSAELVHLPPDELPAEPPVPEAGALLSDEQALTPTNASERATNTKVILRMGRNLLRNCTIRKHEANVFSGLWIMLRVT
jgi:hypothetical protein